MDFKNNPKALEKIIKAHSMSGSEPDMYGSFNCGERSCVFKTPNNPSPNLFIVASLFDIHLVDVIASM